MEFPYKVALVTGASSGIGKSLALEFAKRGCSVGLVARRNDLLEELASQIRGFGVKAEAIACSVSDRGALEVAVEHIERELGGIDLLVANAGISLNIPATNYNLDLVERTYRVNVLGALYTIGTVFPRMIERGKGHIVGISSLASYNGLPMKGTYCGSKAALSHELEALRVELAPKGIVVTTICPGFIKTPILDKYEIALPFLMDVEKATAKIINAILMKKRVYNFPWQTTLMAKIARMLPKWLFDWVMTGIAKKQAKNKRGAL